MKPVLISFLTLTLAVHTVSAHEPVIRARTAVNIPDVPGYLTLKCDLHTHTVFSDGYVWPTVRSEEAWREGLDAIAITDHIEYQPHRADITTNHNRSYQIARKTGDDLDVIVIKGSEITHKMPPGHLNAIFLTNAAPLATADWRDECRIAKEQGAFIFWNHPGWDAQLTDGQVVWHDEHTWLLEQGILQGLEVVNGRDYYPEAHRWAIEKKLTMLSNSDVHMPLNMDYHVNSGDHRPMTLVFASARTADAIKEALLARRTAVYSGGRLIGDEAFLKPIFEKSVGLHSASLTLAGTERSYLQIHNGSDISYELQRTTEAEGLRTQGSLILAGGKTVLLELRARSGTASGARQIELKYQVQNLLIGPDQPLSVHFPITVTFASRGGD